MGWASRQGGPLAEGLGQLRSAAQAAERSAGRGEVHGALFWRNLCTGEGLLPPLQSLAVAALTVMEGSTLDTAGPLAVELGKAQQACANPACTCMRGASEAELSGAQLKRCSRCRTSRYCSQGCQRANWPAHRRACGTGAMHSSSG